MSNRIVLGALGICASLILACGGKSTPGDQPVCGNDLQEISEECDGTDLGGGSCASLGLEGGDLACTDECGYDVSGCTGNATCGNSIREYPEECDASDLAGSTCLDLGYTGGVLACSTACSFDTSRCDSAAVCGNGAVEGNEECDDQDLDGETCASLGLADGTLRCSSSCRFDVAGCTGTSTCGNGAREYPEECDTNDLDGEDCVSQGFDSGTLACAGDCHFDSVGCSYITCGNGIIDAGEECDDGNTSGSDGCSATCVVEAGWRCTGEPSVCQLCADGDGDGYGVGVGCLGTDCNDANGNIHPGAAETCNATDDNCDGAIDENADAPCYDGPAGTQGVGVCQAGVQYCVAGALGPCVGQIQPGAEACNGLDDDCDTQVDEDTVTLTCGLGECAASTPACVGGQLQQCVPGTPGNEVCGNGLDDDCDGLIDEGCACVHVAPFGDDNDAGDEANPKATIGAAITQAAQPGQPKVVCVAAEMSCAWTFYDEDVVMVDGVSVYGGYDPRVSPWVQQPLHTNGPTCVTEIRGQTDTGLYFGVGVTSTTILDNFALSLAHPAGNVSAVITVEGSTGAQITNSSVFGARTGTETYGIRIVEDTTGPATPATPLIYSTLVEGGAGTTSAAIYSYRSSPTIQTACSPGYITAGNRCLHGCTDGIHLRGNRFQGPSATYPDFSYGVWLVESPGSTVDQSMVCAAGNTEAVAIKVQGDAAGTVISRSDAGVWRADADSGVVVEECGGAAPWIGDNARIYAEGNMAGTGAVAAIRATGDCHPVIEGNVLIVGGVEGMAAVTRGVLCQSGSLSGVPSLCNIINNQEIRGSNGNLPTRVAGIRCEDGACNVIQGNQLIHGNAGVNVTGIQLAGPTSAFVDANRIVGGCGTTFAAGIFAEDAAARIQNNSISGGGCNSGSIGGNQYFGIFALLADGQNELDIHSNMIDGGGMQGGGCTSRGITLDLVGGGVPPAGPLTIIRNNIIEAGRCPTRYAISERAVGADPRILEHNDLLWPGTATALYLDEFATGLDIAGVNAMTDLQSVIGNIDQDPLWTILGSGFANIGASSPCRNAGIDLGAPTWDFERDTRPQESAPDIGPDEYVP